MAIPVAVVTFGLASVKSAPGGGEPHSCRFWSLVFCSGARSVNRHRDGASGVAMGVERKVERRGVA